MFQRSLHIILILYQRNFHNASANWFLSSTSLACPYALRLPNISAIPRQLILTPHAKDIR
jgi:hypothetical protein